MRNGDNESHFFVLYVIVVVHTRVDHDWYSYA